ncbi:hypothetical protein CBR_g643 [Chara braunii]|uniref:alpha-1,2-Mannosidase n=1 Tax=Chara braunii TaxID=69332 RepID=A0A388KBV2_CHABU|nr:hypothetical protein CBR_g643 [Chara braunii]|eukprot:GBG67509.1 hypothetical protein CBR_g643 [Chara braunii]
MGRRSSSGGSWGGYLHAAYYIRRPKKFALICGLFIVAMLILMDRHSAARELKLLEEKLNRLKADRKTLEDKINQIVKTNDIHGPGGTDGGDLDTEKNEEVVAVGKEGQPGGKETGVQGDDGISGRDSNSKRNRKVGPLETEAVLRGHTQSEEELENERRREAVKDAFLHAWKGYEDYAWGMDELQLDASMFGRDCIAIHLVRKCEYTLRPMVLGGLLSAYDLSGDKRLLLKAKELADRLLPAWQSPSGIPYTTLNLASGRTSNAGWSGYSSILADLGTETLEFVGLSQRTLEPKYKETVEKTITYIRDHIFPDNGLVPIYINPESGTAVHSKITFGAMGDSFYEYLLKAWIQGGKTEEVQFYWDMWKKSMKGLKTLVRTSSPSGYVYLAERANDNLIPKMDHLACFAAGMLALGADGPDQEEYIKLAEELARTCYGFYEKTPSTLSGENYNFIDGRDFMVGTPYNILRPETVESLMILYRVTKKPIYRDWGWNIFQSFEKKCKAEVGYAGLRDVTIDPPEKDDTMQSFFLAETLKYLYLLFSEPTVIPLDQWVFNTEAHPLRIIPRLGGPTRTGTTT